MMFLLHEFFLSFEFSKYVAVGFYVSDYWNFNNFPYIRWANYTVTRNQSHNHKNIWTSAMLFLIFFGEFKYKNSQELVHSTVFIYKALSVNSPNHFPSPLVQDDFCAAASLQI